MSADQLKKKLVVRGLEISPPIALAPMVGISHSAFRSLVQEEGGVGVLFTEMLAAKRLPHDNPCCSPLLVRDESEQPLIYQIIAAGEAAIGPAVEKLHLLGAQGIDLNLGCPAPMQRRQGAGAVLATNHGLLRIVLRHLRKSTELPLSVKIRLGDRLDVNALRSFCLFLEAEGVDMITIHARLNGEKFCRKPRWELIGEVKDTLSIPIIANGGIFSPADARKCLEVSGADGLMIGRGAVERPWLCAEIAREVYGVKICREPKGIPELYGRYIRLLETRFAPERRLGRLKQFTHYFAGSLQFGHHLAASVQSSGSIDQAGRRAAAFFAQSLGLKLQVKEDEMIDLIKKAVLTGIGVASLTKDKIEELAKELIVKGKMSEQEGEKLVQEMLSRAEESRETMKSQTETLVRNTISRMQLARTEDIELLKAELEKLREEIVALQKEAK